MAVKLGPSAVAVYNPYGEPTTDYDSAPGQAGAAMDGNKSTIWHATVDPSQSSTQAIGLTLKLPEPLTPRRLDVLTSTDGISVGVYGTSATTPPAKDTDKGWVKIGTWLGLDGQQPIQLDAGGRKFRYVLLMITDGPSDGSGKVGIAELKLTR